MDAEDRRLLIDTHGIVSGIKPVLEGLASDQKILAERQRRSEVLAAEHGVKIERINEDIDGLGRKVRSQAAVKLQPHYESRWLAFLEVLAVLPKYGHVILMLSSLTLAAAALLLRLTGHLVQRP